MVQTFVEDDLGMDVETTIVGLSKRMGYMNKSVLDSTSTDPEKLDITNTIINKLNNFKRQTATKEKIYGDIFGEKAKEFKK